MNVIEASKQMWAPVDQIPTCTEINCGSLQRIASAVELMAVSHAQLIDERDRYKRRLDQSGSELDRERRRTAALRGYIKRLKLEKKHR